MPRNLTFGGVFFLEYFYFFLVGCRYISSLRLFLIARSIISSVYRIFVIRYEIHPLLLLSVIGELFVYSLACSLLRYCGAPCNESLSRRYAKVLVRFGARVIYADMRLLMCHTLSINFG